MEAKKEIMDMAKARGLDIAEESIEALCHLGVDILVLLAKENVMATGIMAALEPMARVAIDKIDLDKDGE